MAEVVEILKDNVGNIKDSQELKKKYNKAIVDISWRSKQILMNNFLKQNLMII